MSIFRKAKIQDYDEVMKLKKEVHDFHVLHEPGFYKNPDILMSFDDYKNEVEKNKIFVLESENIIVGYAFIGEIKVENNPLIFDQKILFIDDFCISRNQKRKGFGRELFNYIEKYGKENGYTSIELNVWDFNDEAIKFYEQMSMKPTRIRMKKEIL